MVERYSESPQAIVSNAPRITTQALGQVAVKQAGGMFSTQVASPQVAPVGGVYRSGENSLLTNALTGLQKTLGIIVESQQRKAYLDGAAAVGLGISEDNLETNPITRSWALAGHRDTTAGLAIADYQATAKADMVKLREQGPEAVQDYLQKHRNRLIPAIEGMSLKGREQAYQQLLTADRAIISSHNSEHSKFIVEQMMAEKRTRLTVGLDSLKGSEGTPAYDANLDDTLMTLYNTVFLEDRLDPAKRDELMVEFLTVAMADGHLGLYEKARALPLVPDGMGGHLSLVRMLEFDDQIKLSDGYEKYQNRIAHLSSADWWDGTTGMEVALESGERVPFGQYQRHLEDGVRNKWITPNAASTKMVSAARKAQENATAFALGDAVFNGDYTTMAQMGGGKSYKSLYISAEEALMGDATAAQRYTRALSVGLNTGNPGAMQRAGEYIQPAIAQMRTSMSDEPHASVVEMFDHLSRAEEEAKAKGLENFGTNILSVLEPEDRAFLSNYLHLTSVGGYDPASALGRARKIANEVDTMPAAARAELVRKNNAANSAIVDGIVETPNRWWGLINKVGQMIPGTGASENAALRTNMGMAGWNDSVVEREKGNLRMALYETLNHLDVTGQSHAMSVDQREEVARADVLSRSIPVTSTGNMGMERTNRLILPVGSNLSAVFGLRDSSFGPEHIGEAIGDISAVEGQHAAYSFQDGKVFVEYFTESSRGIPVGSRYLEPGEITDRMYQLRQHGDAQAVEVYGAGKVREGTNGAAVTFNGENTTGVQPEVAFRIRDNLVTHEGIRNQAYADGERDGKKLQSVGVGISSGFSWAYPSVDEDGTVSNEAISESFKKASDYMMGKAKTYMGQYGVVQDTADQSGLELVTNVLYQMGEGAGWTTHGPKLLKAMAERSNAMLEYLHDTPAYKQAGPKRQRFYDQLLTNYARGYTR